MLPLPLRNTPSIPTSWPATTVQRPRGPHGPVPHRPCQVQLLSGISLPLLMRCAQPHYVKQLLAILGLLPQPHTPFFKSHVPILVRPGKDGFMWPTAASQRARMGTTHQQWEQGDGESQLGVCGWRLRMGLHWGTSCNSVALCLTAGASQGTAAVHCTLEVFWDKAALHPHWWTFLEHGSFASLCWTGLGWLKFPGMAVASHCCSEAFCSSKALRNP